MIMTSVRLFSGLLAILLITTYPAAQASDIEKEKRWSEQISDAIFVGDPIQLKAGELEFLAIYTEAGNGNPADAALIMHGIGVHPDWDRVIMPLRTGLPDRGWNTLSLQMPILANDATETQYVPLMSEVPERITAGLDYLKEQGAKRIVIIGHSLGASMGAYYLASHEDPAVIGFIGIGMNTSEEHPEIDTPTSLKSINIPVFDLYGESDLAEVLNSAPQRLEIIEAQGNKASSQRMVNQADHFFTDLDTSLVGIVLSWINNLP